MTFFNKDNNGAYELACLTGTYSASNAYSNIESEVIFATEALTKLLGEEVMRRASTFYITHSIDNSLDAKLVQYIQRSIACLATSRYHQQTLVSHGDNGRKVKADGAETMAWEWMIERDDSAARERYYRSLDSLFGFLEQNSDYFNEWGDAPVHARLKGCLVGDLVMLEQVYPVDGSYYTYFRLLPLMQEVQEEKLRPICGEYWEPVINGGPSSQLARRYIVLSALAEAVRRWSLDVFPLSVARAFCSTYQGGRGLTAATKEEMLWFIDSMENAAGDVCRRLLNLVKPTTATELFAKNNPQQKHFNMGL
ncbi:MAG: hypothetical protein J6R74_03075 [Tidjanibacter sp.]|nr:hypothetical protein [Tidjanibacter sp.]